MFRSAGIIGPIHTQKISDTECSELFSRTYEHSAGAVQVLRRSEMESERPQVKAHKDGYRLWTPGICLNSVRFVPKAKAQPA